MKKIMALGLSVLLLATSFPASAAKTETVTQKGFYIVNWNDLEEVDGYTFDHVYHMPFTWVNTAKLDQDPLPVLFKCYNTSNIQKVAKLMYEDFSKRPEGTRIFNYAAMATILKNTVVDVVDMEKGVALSVKWLEALLAEYKALGGELDGIAIDLEYNKCYTYYIETEQYNKGNTDVYNQIVNNPVYQERIRPALVEQGFLFYENPDPAKYPERSEIWSIRRSDAEGGNSRSRSIWSQTMQRLLVEYINRAAFEPLMKYYPDAFLSDYKTGDVNTWYKPLDSDGSTFGYNYVKAGNTSNYNAYQWQPSASMFGYADTRSQRNKYAKPAGYYDAVYPDTPYGQFLYEVNLQKRMLLSTENGRTNAWLTFFNYGSSKAHSYSNTAYYAEHIFHSGLINSETFFGYIIASEVRNKGSNFEDKNIGSYGYNLKVIDDALAELTRVAGSSDRKPIVLPMDWNGYTLSGMYAGGRNIWRITPDTDKVSVTDFKVKDTAPTFQVDGVTITFPQGRIIEDGNVRQVGSCGYWVETPADVVPVVTGEADRFANNPAFEDTFDGYKTDFFGESSVLPDTYWSINGDSIILEKDGNKTLAIFGNTVLSNVKVPEKITAGDYYAKRQCWQVDVTVPEGDYGQVRLLSYDDVDKGFKLQKDMAFYDDGGNYIELTGVILTPGTYTFKREMDFEQFTSSYYVYDGNGKLLDYVEDVPLKRHTLPVEKITIRTYNAEEYIQLDNYKLYPMGVQTSLDLYGAEYGRKVSETDAKNPQTEDTAYRFSWMNATDTHQVARIYDAKTGTILKKVEMAPGMSGLVTDVVKIADGQEILFAVHIQDDATALIHPDYDKGDFAWTAAAENLGLAMGKKGSAGIATPIPTGDGVGEAGENIASVLNGSKNETDPDDPVVGADDDIAETGVKKGVLALMAGLCLAVVGAVTYSLVIKPKRNARSDKKSAEE